MSIAGFGRLIPSGITSSKLRVREDAFLPLRNLMFLVAGAAYAARQRSSAVAIGLLNDSKHLFPDQTVTFVQVAESTIKEALGRKIAVLTPLMVFNKSDMLALSKARGVTGTYSCHMGKAKPCGRCVSCLEVKGLKSEVNNG